MTDDDKYFLAAYRTELADLYREEAANTVDGTANQWMLTRYHHNESAEEGATQLTAEIAEINGSESVVNDSDVASELVRGVAGGMVIAGRVEGVADAAKVDAAATTGVASDGTALDDTDTVRTTRANDGQIILAQVASDRGNVTGDTYTYTDRNAFVTLPDGAGMGTGAQTYDWILDPETDEDGNVVPVEAGDVGEVRAPLQTISGVVWADEDNNGVRDENPTTSALDGISLALERYALVATRDSDGVWATSGTWERDLTWADQAAWDAYDANPLTGLAGTGDGTSRTTVTAPSPSTTCRAIVSWPVPPTTPLPKKTRQRQIRSCSTAIALVSSIAPSGIAAWA